MEKIMISFNSSIVLKLTLAILFVFMAFLCIACSDDPVSTDETRPAPQEEESEVVEEFGTVTGVVTAANGVTPIQGALVRLKAEGNTSNYDGPQSVTDAEGRYVLEDLSAGDQILVVTKGVFLAEIVVNIQAGSTIEAAIAELKPVAKLAFIPGEFDSMEDILQEELGLELNEHIEEISPSDLLSADVLSQYAMILINCGSDIYFDISENEDFENLREYINSGGLVYLSDLEMPLLWLLFPDEFPFDEFYDGEEGTVHADIIFDPLSDFLGESSVDIVFDLDGWMGINEELISDLPEILIRGDYVSYDYFTDEEVLVEDGPLAIYLEYGDGAVIFTSFHNTGSATIGQRAVLQFYIFGFGDPDLQSIPSPIPMHHMSEASQRQGFVNSREHRHSTEIIKKLSDIIQSRNN